jgi:hypothetical protein
MTPTTRQRNQRGEFTPITRQEVAASTNQPATIDHRVPILDGQTTTSAGEQIQTTSPTTTTGFGTLVTMKRWKIGVTPSRTQLFLGSFIMLIKFLSMLSITAFWGCVIMCIKTFPSWNGPINLFNGYMRRSIADQAGLPIEAEDNAWEDLFPAAETLNAYTLRLSLNMTGNPMAVGIHEYVIPLLIGNPLTWAGLMTVAFLSYHFLSFIHGCLQQASRATKIITRHRST